MSNHNCFTFSPLGGITEGIDLHIGVPSARNDGTVYPPHVGGAGGFIMLDRHNKPVWEDGRLVSAKLRFVDTDSGRVPLLSRRQSGDTSTFFLFIDLNKKVDGVRAKHDGETIRAWQTVETKKGEVHLHDRAAGQWLVEMKEGNGAMIFTRDGSVYQIAVQSHELVKIAMSPCDMARERVELARRQLDQLDDDAFRIRHGVIGGVVRLLQAYHHRGDVKEVFIDFLCEFIGPGEMSNSARKQVFDLLSWLKDTRRGMFSADNVTSLHHDARRPTPAESAARRALVDKKRADRRERDRQEWLAKQTGGKKKG